MLLVAAPAMNDPRFARSVVLVLDHDHTGTLGVVLNRTLDLSVAEVIPDWASNVSTPTILFGGGPVARDSALAVGVLAVPPEAAPPGWRPMYGRVGLIDLDAPEGLLSQALAGMRVFAGYAGWSPGQLEEEIDEGGWLVVDAMDEDVVTSAPEGLWGRVLRRQGGDLALLSTCPADPGMN